MGSCDTMFNEVNGAKFVEVLNISPVLRCQVFSPALREDDYSHQSPILRCRVFSPSLRDDEHLRQSPILRYQVFSPALREDANQSPILRCQVFSPALREDDYRNSPVSFEEWIGSINRLEDTPVNENVKMLYYCDLEEFFVKKDNFFKENTYCDINPGAQTLDFRDLVWFSVNADGSLIDTTYENGYNSGYNTDISLSEFSFCDSITFYKHNCKKGERNTENTNEKTENEVETLTFDDLENFFTWNLSDISYEYFKTMK